MPNINANPSVEQLENTISAYINSVYKDVPPTEEEFKEKSDLMRASMAAIMPVSDQEYDEILKRLKQTLVIQMDIGTYINDRNNGHQSWLPAKRADFDFFFWNRYKKLPIDPATMMMAVALFSIEQQLGNIAEMEQQILSFLEIEKEAEIEADVKTLMNIVSQYKYNWDNEHFVASNHKMILDIQRTARRNMIAYQKKVSEVLEAKQLLVAQKKVNSTLKDLLKKFKYYRLSLYTFAMSAFLEIMLSGNFKEEYISGIKAEIEKNAMDYRTLYGDCSIYLEKLSHSAVEANVLKGVGAASKAVGKFIGSIPVIKEGPVDEFLQDSGTHLKKNAAGMERGVIGAFAEISNPGTGIFVDKLKDMAQIYNHTEEIYFDDKKIYLVAG